MKYEYWFSAVHPLSGRKKELLRSQAESAEELFYIEEKELDQKAFLTEKDRRVIREWQKGRDPEEEYGAALEKGIKLVLCTCAEYPRKLKEIAGYPYALYVKGRLPREELPAVAIVGARQCSRYGELQALEFASALAGAGVQILSGMARGIDGAAGRGALNAGGSTYAVLGSGVDICYPAVNRGLYSDILESGGLISEQPPGTPPRKENFPARNRIISGLSDAVLVMEARERSGSLITADMALDQGREVYALPGPLTSPLSRGCNALIRQGAGILLSPGELLEELGISGSSAGMDEGKKSDKDKKVLESTENIVYSCVGLYPRGIQSLLSETGIQPPLLMETLVSLELKGYIKEISKNYYIRVE